MKLRRTFYILTLVLILLVSFAVASCGFSAEERFNNNREGLIAVSYRGDTENYPENSLEGIRSAFELGAHMVSVGVVKTADGVFVLAEDENPGNVCNTEKDAFNEITLEELETCNLFDNCGQLTEYKITTLMEALDNTVDSELLILDINPGYKDEVYDLLLSAEATDRVVLRFKENSKSINRWINSKEVKPQVIGVYSGNIVWNAILHIENLSENCRMVQYQSKNYFNVMYGSFVAKRYSSDGNARALAPTYDYDLCGQREDNASGWNELIEKGFSAIETNNIKSLVEYTERADELNESLENLLVKTENIDYEIYSDVSADNLRKAVKKANEIVLKGVASVGELESVNSRLLTSLNRLNLSDGYESQKGALNITAGKVIAAVLVGFAILAGQIYVHKMQKDKRRND
jgi:hypothetical protein